jgi:hypothetical protein
MDGDLNAFGLLLVILLTGAVLMRRGTLTGSLRRTPAALGIAFSMIIIAMIFLASWQNEVSDSHQFLIPLVCLVLLLTFTQPSELRTTAGFAVGLAAFLLSIHSISLAGTSYTERPRWVYTGNPMWARETSHSTARRDLREVRSWLADVAEDDTREYRAGWLADSAFSRKLPADYLRFTKARSVEIHSFWHTPLTGLYGRTYHELSLWYPGGRLKDGLKRLEFRPR